MQEASERIRDEKRALLPQPTPSESLAIYLELWQTGKAHFDFQKPSEYLLRVQRIYQRMLEATCDWSYPQDITERDSLLRSA